MDSTASTGPRATTIMASEPPVHDDAANPHEQLLIGQLLKPELYETATPQTHDAFKTRKTEGKAQQQADKKALIKEEKARIK